MAELHEEHGNLFEAEEKHLGFLPGVKVGDHVDFDTLSAQQQCQIAHINQKGTCSVDGIFTPEKL